MRRHLCILLCLVFLLPALLLAGVELPAISKSDQVIRHTAYTLCYSEKFEQASWAAYTLTAAMLGAKCPRSDDFRPDPFVKTGSATPKDYAHSGYDKGHLVPANDMKISSRCMSETFYMSNMSPQVPAFNRGIWKRLEDAVRKWAAENGEIHIATGPVLTGEMPLAIGPAKVAVPRTYYKVILDYQGPELKAIGFLLPNRGSKDDLSLFAVTVDEVEEATGIDFFADLPPAVEEQLESKIELEKWFPAATVRTNGKENRARTERGQAGKEGRERPEARSRSHHNPET